jgi:hypothetical protein
VKLLLKRIAEDVGRGVPTFFDSISSDLDVAEILTKSSAHCIANSGSSCTIKFTTLFQASGSDLHCAKSQTTRSFQNIREFGNNDWFQTSASHFSDPFQPTIAH